MHFGQVFMFMRIVLFYADRRAGVVLGQGVPFYATSAFFCAGGSRSSP